MTVEHGLVIIHTGNGKGKTTAALGLVLRALGAGLKVKILQFIKGGATYSELKALKVFGEQISIEQCGEGFTRRGNKDQSEHIAAAQQGLLKAQEIITQGSYDMVLLDELNYAIDFGLVKIEDAITLIQKKPAQMHLIITGRNAKQELIEHADLVTEMREIKHPYKQGIKAQRGIEF